MLLHRLKLPAGLISSGKEHLKEPRVDFVLRSPKEISQTFTEDVCWMSDV